MPIKSGDLVQIRTAYGDWLNAIAATGVEPTHRSGRQIHDFPVVMVIVPPSKDPMPWPAEDIRRK